MCRKQFVVSFQARLANASKRPNLLKYMREISLFNKKAIFPAGSLEGPVPKLGQ